MSKHVVLMIGNKKAVYYEYDETAARRETTHSQLVSGGWRSPMVVRVRVDQKISDGCESQGGPIKRPQVLLQTGRVVADRARIAPPTTKPFGRRDEEVERGEPVRT